MVWSDSYFGSGISPLLSRTLQSTSQLPVRVSMLLLGGLVVLADFLGLDILLGAFAAGSLVGLAARGPGAEPFRQKLGNSGLSGARRPDDHQNRARAGRIRAQRTLRWAR